MKKPVTIKSMVLTLALVLVLQLTLMWVSRQEAEAADEGRATVGRYQVSTFGGITAMGIGNGKEVPRIIRGYVVIDTTTGKVVDKKVSMQIYD